MKKISAFLFCFVFLTVTFLFTASAEKYGDVKFIPPDDYTLIDKTNISENTDIVKALGYTSSSLKKYFEDNGMLAMAVNDDLTSQIKLSSFSTEFSKQIGSLADLDGDALSTVAKKIISNDSSKWKISTQNGVNYIETHSVVNSDGKKSAVVQYVTVNGGIMYTLCFYSNGGDFSENVLSDAYSSVCGLTFKSETAGSHNVFYVIIISAAILLSAAAIIYIVVTFCKDIVSRATETDNGTIKRRDK